MKLAARAADRVLLPTARVRERPRERVPRARIELRQIGVRDAAGGSGRPRHLRPSVLLRAVLDDFVPVSIKMAKTQNLSL